MKRAKWMIAAAMVMLFGCMTSLLAQSKKTVEMRVPTSTSITGTVKDTSGAVLPGVTVEAASPALIEKVRTTVTDDKGEYRIIELRPGTYTVSFTLPQAIE